MLIVRRTVGESMLPWLRPNGILLATRRYRVLKPGDLVVVRHGGIEKVKRIEQIAEGKIYILGTNPAASTDSRHFGWLEMEAVLGKVVWPRDTGHSK